VTPDRPDAATPVDKEPDAGLMPSHRLRQRKRAIRREVIERRDAMPPSERAAASRRIADRLMELPEVREATTVMAFWSFGSEVETAPALERLERAGKRIVLPRVEGEHVVAVRYALGDEVAAAAFGAMEPTGTALVAPDEVDVVITPGVAFDREGRRVGYGGGFYDRFLPRTRQDVSSVAVAFDLQVLDEPLPTGSFDRPVDAIVTQSEVIRPPAT
jgi:5-formyltetrahydrofolate cyclo-ligase